MHLENYTLKTSKENKYSRHPRIWFKRAITKTAGNCREAMRTARVWKCLHASRDSPGSMKKFMKEWSRYKERRVDALAPRAEERRDKLR